MTPLLSLFANPLMPHLTAKEVVRGIHFHYSNDDAGSAMELLDQYCYQRFRIAAQAGYMVNPASIIDELNPANADD